MVVLPTYTVFAMSALCKACGTDLPDNGDHVVCSECKSGLHYECCTLKADSWLSMSSSKKRSWRCHICNPDNPRVKAKARGLTRSESSTSILSQFDDQDDLPVTMSNIQRLLDVKFREFNGNMDKRFKDVEKSLEFNGGNIQDLQKSFKDLQQKMIVMEKNQEKLETQNQELRKKVKDLEHFVQDMVQDGNKCKVEVTGIPQNVDYKIFTAQVLEKIEVSNIEFSVEKTTIRKPNCAPEVKSLVVTFQSEEIRDKVLEKVRKNKPNLKTDQFSSQQPVMSIYINECLSAYMKKLFYEAKRLKQDKNYAFAWVRNGRILIKKTEGANAIRLRSLEDLAKV